MGMRYILTLARCSWIHYTDWWILK